MTMTSVVDLVNAGDAAALRGALAADPSLAAASRPGEVSPLLTALYQRRPNLAAIIRETTAERLNLFEAAALGDGSRVDELVADPEAPSAISPDGFSALHLAAYFGQRAVADRLLEAGADPNRVAGNPSQVRPLHSATSAQHAGIVAKLLAAGADSNATQEGGWTPLHQAAHTCNREILRLLLAHGGNPAVRSHDGRTPAQMLPEAAGDDLRALLASTTGDSS